MAEKTMNKSAASAIATGDGRKKKLLITAAAVILLLLIIGVVAGVLFGNKMETQDVSQQQDAPIPAPAIYVSLGDRFVTMLQHEGRRHYCQMTLSVLTRDESTVGEIEVHAPLIRGRLVSLLGEQDFEALRTDAGRQLVRERILSTIQEVLQKEIGRPGVEQVFFTDLVLQ